MNDRTLSAWQVASLLVSTSCGIGFLLGTGELALQQGMAASLYAVTTAIGLLILSIAAPRLWRTGQSIWAHFEFLYSPVVSRHVATLSLIWMTGVLSAQIRGASSVLALYGVPSSVSIVVIDCLVMTFSLIRLSWLSSVFAICMCGCNVLLIRALAQTHSLTAWFHAPANFLGSVRLQPPAHVGLLFLSVVAMVLYGADYQQFPLAARSPGNARMGCVIAAVIVFGLGFLPSTAVIAGAYLWHLNSLSDPVQVVPRLLALSLGKSGHIISIVAILLLVTTALGSACSILRAMADAIASVSSRRHVPSAFHRLLPVGAATLLATRGQGLIETMVTLNIIYLAAVGPLLGLTLLRHPVSGRAAKRSMLFGFIVATTCVLAERIPVHMPEVMPLALSWVVSLIEALRSRPEVRAPRCTDLNSGLDQRPS
jgi:solute:Na+ symporter, SSS family